MPATATTAALFRIDKFIVPIQAMPAFLLQVNRINQLVGTLPGCMQNLVLTGDSDAEHASVITIAAWASQDAFAAAKAFVQQQYAADGFNPAAYMQQLGIRADLGIYQPA